MIKIIGDVASVRAAISTGISFADQRDGLVAHKVISDGDGILSHSVTPESEPTPAPTPVVPHEEMTEDHAAPEAPQDAELISCNLCLDPACPVKRRAALSLSALRQTR